MPQAADMAGVIEDNGDLGVDKDVRMGYHPCGQPEKGKAERCQLAPKARERHDLLNPPKFK
jgi:hypothetical protein